MVFKNCDKSIPTPGDWTEDDKELLASAAVLYETAASHVAQQSLQSYVETLIGIVVQANKYIDTQEPWVLRKTDPARMATVLYVILEVLRTAAILYQPVIPTAAGRILDQLGVAPEERTFAQLASFEENRLDSGTAIQKPTGVFPRIEIPEGMLVEQ